MVEPTLEMVLNRNVLVNMSVQTIALHVARWLATSLILSMQYCHTGWLFVKALPLWFQLLPHLVKLPYYRCTPVELTQEFYGLAIAYEEVRHTTLLIMLVQVKPQPYTLFVLPCSKINVTFLVLLICYT